MWREEADIHEAWKRSPHRAESCPTWGTGWAAAFECDRPTGEVWGARTQGWTPGWTPGWTLERRVMSASASVGAITSLAPLANGLPTGTETGASLCLQVPRSSMEEEGAPSQPWALRAVCRPRRPTPSQSTIKCGKRKKQDPSRSCRWAGPCREGVDPRVSRCVALLLKASLRRAGVPKALMESHALTSWKSRRQSVEQQRLESEGRSPRKEPKRSATRVGALPKSLLRPEEPRPGRPQTTAQAKGWS